MESIAERIVHKRKELGLTQKELAEKLHVSDKTVSRWETGRQIPDALTMQDIARALNMRVSELYGMEPVNEPLHDTRGGSISGRKIKNIFCLGLIAAAVILVTGICIANRELNSQVTCQIDEFPMYMLTGYDSSIVEWVDYCNTAGEELSHLSALAGDTAYYLFYLPRGCEATELEYSYRYGFGGRVLRLNFRNLSEQADDKYYLCYMKFPCEDIFLLKTYIDGKPLDSYSGYAMFTGLCENILFN